MATVKRVVGADGLYAPWDIYSNVVTIHGNLNILGNTEYLNSTVTQIGNAYITLNENNSGPGVTGNSGIIINRGTSNGYANGTVIGNSYWVWNESVLSFQGTANGAVAKVQGANAVSGLDLVNYYTLTTFGLGAGGSTTQVQYNSGGALTGNPNFTFSNGNLSVYGTNIGDGNVTATGISQDLTLVAPNGKVYVNSVLKLSYQATAPSNVASTTQLFANTVGGGGTGLYVVNSGTGDELITKTKATVLALIFGY
jgi:hypothetical protein